MLLHIILSIGVVYATPAIPVCDSPLLVKERSKLLSLDSPRSETSTVDSESEENAPLSPLCQKACQKLGNSKLVTSRIGRLSDLELYNIIRIENLPHSSRHFASDFAKENPDLFSSLVEAKLIKNRNLMRRQSNGMEWKEMVRNGSRGIAEGDGITDLMLIKQSFNILLVVDVSSSIPRIVIQHLFGNWEETNVFPEEVILEMMKTDQASWKAFKHAITKLKKLEIVRENIVNPFSEAIIQEVRMRTSRDEILIAMPNSTNSFNIVRQLNHLLGIDLAFEKVKLKPAKVSEVKLKWNASITFKDR